MSDTEIMETPNFDGDDKLTESQVIPFKDVPDSVRSDVPSGDQPVSVIGESLHFKGELSAGEDLIIEGTVEGTINQGKCCLTLRPKGTILANVNATKIFVEGTVEGDLHATVSVTVRKSGVVTGNIVAPTVGLEEGATFNGSIEMRSPTK
ncbi:MAG: polymer-forming cytoskeletal protein [Woeseiaceae bacterium]|nr:polymer-forming cytoskeletal protein [Woeseiaceae bacterium]